VDAARRSGARKVTIHSPGRRSALTKSIIALCVLVAIPLESQTNSAERSFPQSKSAIENALKSLQSSLAGRLPVLEGFARIAERPLDRYQRGYYQSTVDVKSAPGGSIVHVTTKVTAWYSDPTGSKSGYQLLVSNGRLETDLLDQLEEQLAKNPAGSPAAPVEAAKSQPQSAPAPQPTPSSSTPSPAAPDLDQKAIASARPALPDRTAAETPSEIAADKNASALQAEADSLQEILKTMAHPKNLVAVKKSGTPIVSNPSLTAKPQFLASMHDEFELLDFNADWVHVRISGLSRGWIWRNSVEMPEGISDTDVPTAGALTPAADLFHVVREESAAFPGDWEPLRSKTVKILSVQKLDDSGKDAGPKERLEYAKFLLEKTYKETAPKPGDLQGIVVIFDAADGGMIAATTATLQEWIAGNLSDSALWHKCFFDPPETFDSSLASGSK